MIASFAIAAVVSYSLQWVTYHDPRATYEIDLPVGMTKKPPPTRYVGRMPPRDQIVNDTFQGAWPGFILEGYLMPARQEQDNFWTVSKNHPPYERIYFSSGPAYQRICQPLAGRDKDWYYIEYGFERGNFLWLFTAWSQPEDLGLTTRFLKRVAVSFVSPRKGVFTIGGVTIPR